MFIVSIIDRLRDVAAVFSRRYGSVTQRAAEAECSRQAVYDHAHAVEQCLDQRDRQLDDLHAELTALHDERDRLRDEAAQRLTVTTDGLRRFAIASQAIGVSLRQAEELLGTLLPEDQVPDHATLGRWTAAAAERAAEVLAALDPLCAPAVQTLCIDEIFFGGSPLWSRSSRTVWPC